MRYAVLALLILINHGALAKVGYVNVAEVIEGTKQGKRVKAQLENQFEQAKKSMEAIESGLKKEKESLEREAPLLSEQARARKIQKFQQKVIESQREMEIKKRELQALEERLMGPVIENLKTVVSHLARREGYHVVHNVGKDVLWIAPDLNLTKKTAAQFNKKHK